MIDLFKYFKVPLEVYGGYILMVCLFTFLLSSTHILKDIRYNGNNIRIKCIISLIINCITLLQIIFGIILFSVYVGIVINSYSAEETRAYLILHYKKYIAFLSFFIPSIIMMVLEKKPRHNIFTSILYLFNLLFFIIAFGYVLSKLSISLFNKVEITLFVIALCCCLIGPLFELLREITKGFKIKSEIKKGVIK
ncbi:hypothetical protein [Clostridium cochlearium]|uniref:hypothetical protein n=1 Tax=Clostridium cochlearium TaxID=1494 RepID=UPI00241D57D9|nr:hypothetical protein [Clostridium cochlearium]MBE6065907.1 hypothetical protein [Clostridium cochlearium]